MNLMQGMRHISMAFMIPTGELDPIISRMLKWLMKIFLLNMKPPRGGAETFVEINMVANNINPTDFEAEKTNLKN